MSKNSTQTNIKSEETVASKNDAPNTTIINNPKGAVVMLAWPETRVSKTGAWYDPISKAIGLIKNNTYKVGHAAFCVVDYNKQKAYYYDFGRYQSPLGYGRVRSEQTDPELTIDISAIIESGSVVNIDKILIKIKENPSSHGDGYLIGVVRESVTLNPVYKYIKELQDKDHVKYAPFKPASTNCSRFASSAFLKPGFESSLSKFLNIISLFQFNLPLKQITQKSHRDFLHIVDDNSVYHKMSRSDFKVYKPKLKKEAIPNSSESLEFIKEDYHELKGVGANAYYKVEPEGDNIYLISRYDDHNYLHFKYQYKLASGSFDINAPFSITYPSHAKVVSILQRDQVVKLKKH